jgi:hypothetical protein
MAAIPDTQVPASESAEVLEEKFRRLASEWHNAVAHHSSTSIRNNYPAYQEIIRLGPDVVPLLLRDVEDNQTHWFYALRTITGADPFRRRRPAISPRW